MFRGSIVALITPMDQHGNIDYDAFKRLIHWHLASGTHGIVVAGSTGESPSVTDAEWRKLIEIAVSEAHDKIPVIAGSGCNVTKYTVEKTREAMQLGVDGCLIVTPYYNRPTQEGLYQHYQTISDAVPIPIILYNVPARTGCDMLPATVRRLKKTSNIVAIKEANPSNNRYQELVNECGDALTVLTGNDPETMDCLAAGGRGTISVTANVAPAKMAALYEAALAGKMSEAASIFKSLEKLNSALFIESNPIPVKWALYHLGKIPDSNARLPLTRLSEPYWPMVREALQEEAEM